jgi:hypothetical protein
MRSRFAPSTTGEAHPGTLLSALLVWLDARARGGHVMLRLEDLDVTRTRAAWAAQLVDACRWLGLGWDTVAVQSDRRAAHEAALDALAAAGRLYPCSCSRATRAGGRRAPDGSWAYDNTCRGRALPPGGWRAAPDAIRARLDDDRIELVDDGGLDLSQTPARDLGDPVVRRRDGVIAYQLAVVVDDHDAAITDVIRGRDIAPSTATQVMLQRLLGMAAPRYRHHFLLLEPPRGGASPHGGSERRSAAELATAELAAANPATAELAAANPADANPAAANPATAELAAAELAAANPAAAETDRSLGAGAGAGKLAKLHGSIPFSALRARYDGRQLCGILAHAAGLADAPVPCRPDELVAGFDWRRVPAADRVARWGEHGLAIDDPAPA